MVKKLSYHESVNYNQADPVKVLAQKAGLATASNMPGGFKELEGTRGESAYIFDMGAFYGALVQEGLGTKSLIAQEVYKLTGKSYFAAVAQDTVAAIINDLVSVGATPVALNAYWSSSSYNWLTDEKLATDFVKGWQAACDMAKVAWGGGETQSLPGIVEKNALEFAGSGFGVIKPKTHLINGQKLRAGDIILLIASSGVHANGISLTREIAKKLKNGYQTKLKDGSTYGETLLKPTAIYSRLIQQFLDQKLDIHYLSNITGHGWRKLMRASQDFTYVIEKIPTPPLIFDFIQQQSDNDLEEMYSAFNMGAGYAVYLPEQDVQKAQDIIKKMGLTAWVSGFVKAGPKRLVIKPRDITFDGHSLEVR